MICLFYISNFFPYNHIDNLKIFLVLLDNRFDIMCEISESHLSKNHPLTTSIDILDHNLAYTNRILHWWILDVHFPRPFSYSPSRFTNLLSKQARVYIH